MRHKMTARTKTLFDKIPMARELIEGGYSDGDIVDCLRTPLDIQYHRRDGDISYGFTAEFFPSIGFMEMGITGLYCFKGDPDGIEYKDGYPVFTDGLELDEHVMTERIVRKLVKRMQVLSEEYDAYIMAYGMEPDEELADPAEYARLQKYRRLMKKFGYTEYRLHEYISWKK